jgi:hypothetical protein
MYHRPALAGVYVYAVFFCLLPGGGVRQSPGSGMFPPRLLRSRQGLIPPLLGTWSR